MISGVLNKQVYICAYAKQVDVCAYLISGVLNRQVVQCSSVSTHVCMYICDTVMSSTNRLVLGDHIRIDVFVWCSEDLNRNENPICGRR